MAGLEIAENECISLIKGQLPLGAYQVPVTLSHLPSDFKTSKNLTRNVFYVPLDSNMKSADSFFVLELNGLWTLIVLQFTDAAAHGVRADGLVEIFSSFTDTVRKDIKRKVVLFVTPSEGKLCEEQSFLDTNGDTYKTRARNPAIDFEQWLYRRTFNFSDGKYGWN